MNKFLPTLKGFITMLILILTASVVNAQTRTASVSGFWNNVTTWGGASVPTSANDVVINNGVTVTVNVTAACASVTIGATDQTGGITISGTNSLAVTNGITIGDLTDNSSGIVISVGTGSLSCASLTMADVTGSNDDIALTISSGSVTVTGSLTMNGAAAENRVIITGAGTLTVGDLSPTNGTFTNSATSTVNYTGGIQTIRPTSYLNLTLTGTGAKTITGVTVNGTLSVQGTATTAGTTPTYGAAAILEYKGSTAQTISNVEFNGTGANPTNLRIDNANGVALNSAKTINGALALVNGYLTTTGLLTISTAGSATTSNGAFVNGQLAKMTASSGVVFTFPVGTIAGGLRTIGITTTGAGATTYTAQFFKGNPKTVYPGTIQSPLVQISECEYWTLGRSTSGSPANANVTLSWASNSCGSATYVTNHTTLLVAKHNGSWVSEGNTSSDGLNKTVTSAIVTSFSPFALGTSNASQNPLPVTFDNAKAYEKNGGVQIEWSNMTESDIASYTVERSNNGQNFTSVSQHSPKSNLIRAESYTSFDASPFTGVNLYRIKVLENSGKIVYSKILRVDISNNLQSLSLYPNPVKGNLLSVGINAKQGQYNLSVLNNAGQQVYSKILIHQGGNMTQTIELPSAVKAGVYNMVISGDNFRQTKMFIIQ